MSTILCLQFPGKKETNLLDIRDLGGKALRDLRDDLLDERLVFHRLPRFHDTAKDMRTSLNCLEKEE